MELLFLMQLRYVLHEDLVCSKFCKIIISSAIEMFNTKTWFCKVNQLKHITQVGVICDTWGFPSTLFLWITLPVKMICASHKYYIKSGKCWHHFLKHFTALSYVNFHFPVTLILTHRFFDVANIFHDCWLQSAKC